MLSGVCSLKEEDTSQFISDVTALETSQKIESP